jgi:hypothetical protein
MTEHFDRFRLEVAIEGLWVLVGCSLIVLLLEIDFGELVVSLRIAGIFPGQVLEFSNFVVRALGKRGGAEKPQRDK